MPWIRQMNHTQRRQCWIRTLIHHVVQCTEHGKAPLLSPNLVDPFFSTAQNESSAFDVKHAVGEKVKQSVFCVKSAIEFLGFASSQLCGLTDESHQAAALFFFVLLIFLLCSETRTRVHRRQNQSPNNWIWNEKQITTRPTIYNTHTVFTPLYFFHVLRRCAALVLRQWPSNIHSFPNWVKFSFRQR